MLPVVGGGAAVPAPKNAYIKYVLKNPALMQQVPLPLVHCHLSLALVLAQLH